MRQPFRGTKADRGGRRDLLAGAGLVGLAGMVPACGGSDKSGATSASPAPTGQSSAPSAPAPSTTAPPPKTAEPAGKEVAKTADVRVGGGTFVEGGRVVVTQPERGEFRAFSAVCTHRGCLVKTISGGTINCPCHGSEYSVEDASVVSGPATRPLARRRITVEGGGIYLA
ncbi:Rieske 2Fe-2S domain-containing protein [Spirillospora sp. NPDC047279]|uniref:Rieske (2Fe-2S) protein n=1 Tax=Spirillospora sp. NPDC047279 TaxID=3155478 RepID=UPI0033E5EEE7